MAPVLTVALPTLAKSLHASESDLQWFTSGYFLVLAAAMLPAGLLGDRFGHKKVLTIAIALFGLDRFACAYSTSVGEFLAARVVLGLAGAGVHLMAISALTVLFSKEERPKAVGIWAAANFLSLPIGADPRWLDAVPLLVGVGLPDQRAGRGDRRRGTGPLLVRRRCRRRSENRNSA